MFDSVRVGATEGIDDDSSEAGNVVLRRESPMDKPDDDRELRRDTRRRFEQWARNPHCQANALSAVHNVAMADVAKHEGHKPTMGQSPFAIQRGQTFERSLFRD